MDPAPRTPSIDSFRGLCILAMVSVNYLARPAAVPGWLKHAEDIGLTVADFIAPAFVFAIALSYRRSLDRRRERNGEARAYAHFVRRFLAILGIGAFFSAAEAAASPWPVGDSWGTLQALGVAGLVCLPALRLPWWARLLIGATLLATYQLLVDLRWLDVVLASSHGGFRGSLSWAAMLIVATAVVDLSTIRWSSRPLLLAALLLITAGAALSPVVAVSKSRVSASYVCITTGAAGVVYWLFSLLDRWHIEAPLLSTWGRNPLLLYVLHFFFLAVFALPSAPGWYAEAPGYLVGLQLAGLLGAIHLVARTLRRRSIVLSI